MGAGEANAVHEAHAITILTTRMGMDILDNDHKFYRKTWHLW
jgi:hypothetical protein